MAYCHTGMTPSEASVMELWDAGKSMEAISRQLGRTKTSVQRVVSTYHCETSAEDANVRRGTAALLAALQAAA